MSCDLRELALLAHDRGLLAMVEHVLRGYLEATRDASRGPAQRKKLEDALALVSAVLDDQDAAIVEAEL